MIKEKINDEWVRLMGRIFEDEGKMWRFFTCLLGGETNECSIAKKGQNPQLINWILVVEQ